MSEQTVTWFDAPAGDRPPVTVYQPGAWLSEPPPGDEEEAWPDGA
jgi:hypothetical protein